MPGTGGLGLAFYAIEAANYASLALTALLLWHLRWRRGPKAFPRGTLDVFVPVCGEPIEMVEETLRAALAVSYPHRTYLLNDGRIAGKSNWQAVEELAARYEVPCFTRTTGVRGKAANLNHALPLTGGDFVAVIDADHRAAAGLAHETLGYFANPTVGFVCTPQQFDSGAGDPLGNRELLFYTSMQPAKDAWNSAFSCGNGVIYRRDALASVGGFSEWSLVEDVHTSLELHANGWQSVYHPRPITTGTAPQTASTLARQRLRWATDSLRILFWRNPLLDWRLSLRQRLHYLQTTSFYLVGATQTLFLLGPTLYLLWGISVMRFSRARRLRRPRTAVLRVHPAPAHGLRRRSRRATRDPAAALPLPDLLRRDRRGARAVQAAGRRHRQGATRRVLPPAPPPARTSPPCASRESRSRYGTAAARSRSRASGPRSCSPR